MLLKVRNDIQEIERVCDSIREFCCSNDVSEKKCFDILMIVDELATNVINYAFNDGQTHVFDILLEKNNQIVHIQILDEGIPFDPLKKSDPNTEASLEERNIGGLGIFLAKQLSKLITYARIDNKNQLDILVSLNEEE